MRIEANALSTSSYADAILEYHGFSKDAFSQYEFCKGGGKTIFVFPKGLQSLSEDDSLPCGLPFIRIKGKYPKLTSVAAMHFGHLATVRYVDLEDKQLDDVLKRQAVAMSEDQIKTSDPDSYVILRHTGALGRPQGIAMGYVNSEWALASLLPKNWLDFYNPDFKHLA